MSLTLYHASPSRSSTALWMLEEIGQPYEMRLLDLKAGDQAKPDFLAINPMGKVPALVHDGVAIAETAAICAYLADAFPAAKLAPPIGDPRRGPYLKWLFFGPSCFEPALVDKMLERPAANRGTVGWADFDTVMNVLEAALATGPWLLGDQFTAADVVIGSGLRWGSMFKGVPPRPAFTAYLARLMERPALRRASTRDAALMAKPAG